MSQEQLADHLGVTRQSISKWELNTSVPDIEKLKMISRLFDVSLDKLLNNEVMKVIPWGRCSVTSAAVRGWTCFSNLRRERKIHLLFSAA